jgi:hypothetical protein
LPARRLAAETLPCVAEADRVTDPVMRMARPQRTGAIDLIGKAAPDGIQRLRADCGTLDREQERLLRDG